MTDDGAVLDIHGEGIFASTTHIQAILTKQPNVTAMEWGESYSGKSRSFYFSDPTTLRKQRFMMLLVPRPATYWRFDASQEKYRDLQDSRFVSNFRLSPGTGSSAASVEYRPSKIMPGPLCKD